MNKGKNYLLIVLMMAVPVIIYFYFLQWRTTTVYGDDLYMFRDIATTKNLSDVINLGTGSGKYRPVQASSAYVIFHLFHKNLMLYYLYDVLVQTINTYLVALLINLFLRSSLLSLLISLVFGLSRFSFYNLDQIFWGASLEGLAMTFFLSSLFFIMRTLVQNDLSRLKIMASMLLSVLFANLSMCTHERYIILMPFIMLAVFSGPQLKVLTGKQKSLLFVLPIASILLNVAIKKFVYNSSFFVGTGGTNISFSFSNAYAFLKDGILSIFQINSGPEYLTGMRYADLPYFERKKVLFFIGSVFILFALYTVKTVKSFMQKDDAQKNNFIAFFLLAVLFGLCLVPAVVTIRLEQRWLQASFSVFVLMLIVAFSGLKIRKALMQATVLLLLFALLFNIDYNYFHKGVTHLYMKNAENVAANFKHAMDNGTIKPSTTKLYIWENPRNINSENEIKWATTEGYLFNFYQGKSKQLIFVDSLSAQTIDSVKNGLNPFNKDSAQVLYVTNNVIDITGQYLKDSLKNFKY